MIELNNNELLGIDGGASILTGTIISNYIKGASVYYELGKSLGTALNKIINPCNLIL